MAFVVRSTAKLTSSWVVAALVYFGCELPAHAFCQARSCDPDAVGGTDCELDPKTHCSVDGTLLHRPSGCITIGVKKGNAEPMLGISDAEFEQLILEAFARWTSADCGAGNPAIEVQSVGAVDTKGRFSCNALPAQNLSVWMLSDELGDSVVTPLTGTTAGITYPSFVVDTGEIFDTDVELNALWLLVQEPEVLRGHLRTIAAHEAGHVLGLAHSKDEAALMYRNYRVSEEREPTADDVRGICDLYPPAALECPRPKVEEAALSPNACNEAYLSERDEADVEGAADEPQASGCSLATPLRGAPPLSRIFMAALALILARRRFLTACH